MIIATDGLWDAFSNEEAVSYISERLDEPHLGARSIVLQAFYRGSLDNVTVVVVDFMRRRTSGASIGGSEVGGVGEREVTLGLLHDGSAALMGNENSVLIPDEKSAINLGGKSALMLNENSSLLCDRNSATSNSAILCDENTVLAHDENVILAYDTNICESCTGGCNEGSLGPLNMKSMHSDLTAVRSYNPTQ